MSNTCDSCGARLGEGARVCDLCGTPIDSSAARENDSAARESDGATAESDGRVHDSRPESHTPPSVHKGVYCNQCGWKNPVDANFCSRCGSGLQALTERPESDRPSGGQALGKAPALPASINPDVVDSKGDSEGESNDSSQIGRQIGIIVGAAVLLVMALYMITALSDGSSGPATETPSLTPMESEGPLPAQFQDREAELKASIDALSGEEQVEVRRDLIDLYLSAARMDLAAAEQERVAEQLDTENAWAIAGNFYYDYMESREGALRAAAARNAIAAYQRALAINPDNLDIRTDMAIAYLYDPENPMQAIQQTNRVLEADSMHVQANFNRGVMLLQINRIDDAIAQFEKVKQIVGDPDNAVYQRAEQALEAIGPSEASQ